MREDTVDMSSEAIDRRLRELSDLWDFWVRLRADGLASDARESDSPDAQPTQDDPRSS